MAEKKTVAGLLQAQRESEGWIEKHVVANAPLIVAAFSNFVVIVSDVRAYDVIHSLTGSVLKALAASLACAIPFIMWEVSWQYNHTTDTWRQVSLWMAALAFITSITLGIADFVPTLDTDSVVASWLLGGVVVTTGIHTVVGFLYYYNDPDVARRRRKAQSLAQMVDQELNAQVAANLLENGNTLLGTIAQLENKYSPEEVEAVLRILRGEKQEKPTAHKPQGQRPPQQQRQFAETVDGVEVPKGQAGSQNEGKPRQN
jgi:hypothetical protein